MAREEVRLNVYDMCSLNSYISALGVGVYHTGIQVYETEFGYGGHPYDFSGVFEIEPRDEEALGEETFKYRETIVVGYTDFNDDEVRELVKHTGNEFRGDHYHLLHRNCNHFTDSVCKTLCGRGIPAWINRLAYISTCVPFLERCLPKEFLTPVVLEDAVREQVKSNQETLNQSEDLRNRRKMDSSQNKSQNQILPNQTNLASMSKNSSSLW